MTVRELALALSELPDAAQDLPVMIEEEGSYLPVLSILHYRLTLGDDEVSCIELGGAMQAGLPGVLFLHPSGVIGDT